MDRSFNGFVRPDGRVGVRNKVAVIYTVDCARFVSDKIAKSIPNGISVGWYSCYSTEDMNDVNTLVGIGANPNVGAAIVIGLGCQSIAPSEIAARISKIGKCVEVLSIQGAGGTNKTIEKGVQIAKRMSNDLFKLKRTRNELSKLSIGVKFDGSGSAFRASWGLIQTVCDEIANFGGKILLGQSAGISAKQGYEKYPLSNLGLGINPPRSGWYSVDGLVARSERHFGLESDGEPTDLAAAGAQIILRGVESGLVGGNVISPLIKVCADSSACGKMGDDLDFGSVSKMYRKSEEWRRLLDLVIDVASGKQTKSELLGHTEGSVILGGRPLLTIPEQICE